MVKSAEWGMGHPLFHCVALPSLNLSSLIWQMIQSRRHEGGELCSVHACLPRALHPAWVTQYFLNG